MKKLDRMLAFRMATRGTACYFLKRPIAVSFELTHSCSCNCRHCDHGGKLRNEHLLTADDYHRLERELKPVLLQLSGGEPTLRQDLYEIIQAVKEPSGMPYLIVVSNSSELTEERYLKCLELGVNQFSISLDFPDERHDDFRRYKGLFKHLSELIPRLTAQGRNNIVMNTAITRWNLPYLEDCYRKAREWGANISFSAYTSKRTGNSEFDIISEEDLQLLKKSIDRLAYLKRTEGGIVNSDWTLEGTYAFYQNRGVPPCKAGERYMVVNPDGTMRPCSMFDLKYKDRAEMKREFIRHNTCDACYVSIRAYLSASYWTLLSQNVKERVLKGGDNDCGCQPQA